MGRILLGRIQTHQQIDAVLASQGSVLHPLAARREDVLALAGRGLHVGQAEGAQVLHALLHLQLVALPRCKNGRKKGKAALVMWHISCTRQPNVLYMIKRSS